MSPASYCDQGLCIGKNVVKWDVSLRVKCQLKIKSFWELITKHNMIILQCTDIFLSIYSLPNYESLNYKCPDICYIYTQSNPRSTCCSTLSLTSCETSHKWNLAHHQAPRVCHAHRLPSHGHAAVSALKLDHCCCRQWRGSHNSPSS